MQQVYLNINNNLINDIFNLDTPDEYKLDQALIDLIEGNETKPKKPVKAAKETKKKKSSKSDKKIIKIKVRKRG